MYVDGLLSAKQFSRSGHQLGGIQGRAKGTGPGRANPKVGNIQEAGYRIKPDNIFKMYRYISCTLSARSKGITTFNKISEGIMF